MPKLTPLALLLSPLLLPAASIRGTVVENQTGHPLARALVTLEGVAATSGAKLSVRTNSYGTFELTPIPPGAYLITASRRAFAPVQFGQKRWNTSGLALSVAEGESPFVT